MSNIHYFEDKGCITKVSFRKVKATSHLRCKSELHEKNIRICIALMLKEKLGCSHYGAIQRV